MLSTKSLTDGFILNARVYIAFKNATKIPNSWVIVQGNPYKSNFVNRCFKKEKNLRVENVTRWSGTDIKLVVSGPLLKT